MDSVNSGKIKCWFNSSYSVVQLDYVQYHWFCDLVYIFTYNINKKSSLCSLNVEMRNLLLIIKVLLRNIKISLLCFLLLMKSNKFASIFEYESWHMLNKLRISQLVIQYMEDKQMHITTFSVLKICCPFPVQKSFHLQMYTHYSFFACSNS